jgi:hypothetical protein
MLSELPPMLIEQILLASCDDGGSTEAIGNFASTSKGNALTVAESRPVWQAVLSKRFDAGFAARVLEEHKKVTDTTKTLDTPAEEKKTAKKPPAKKKTPAKKTPAKNAVTEPPAASGPSSIRDCAFVEARKDKYSRGGIYTGKVCDFCLERYVKLNAIGKQVEKATGSICCNACCKIHTVNTTDAVAKYGATKGVLAKIKPVATKQWYGKKSKVIPSFSHSLITCYLLLSKKAARLAQKLGQLQSFIDVLPHESILDQLAYFGPT